MKERTPFRLFLFAHWPCLVLCLCKAVLDALSLRFWVNGQVDDLPGHLVLPARFFQITESSTHQGSTARPRLPLLIAWLLWSCQTLEVPPGDTRVQVLSYLHYGTF